MALVNKPLRGEYQLAPPKRSRCNGCLRQLDAYVFKPEKGGLFCERDCAYLAYKKRNLA